MSCFAWRSLPGGNRYGCPHVARSLWVTALSLGVLGGGAACSNHPTSAPSFTAGSAPPPPQRRGSQGAPSASPSALISPPRLDLTEADFTPSDLNRDPFRSYAELFVLQAAKRAPVQHKGIADQYSLDELKLVAIVTGQATSRAMFVDPQGKGWVVTRGEPLGRAELVRAGTGDVEHDVTWKVDRIREGDVVFIREDPAHSNVAPATRVIALRPEGDAPAPNR